MKREDGGRRTYLKKYFNKDVEDPLLYLLVNNTGRVALEDAVKMVGSFASNLTAPHPAKFSRVLSKAS